MDANLPEKMKEIKYLTTVFDDNMNTELYKLVSMSSICRIFDSKQLCDVIGGILSLYGLMNETVLEDEAFQNSLLNEGIQLNALKIKGKSDLWNYITFVDPELNKKFFQYLNTENLNDDNSVIRIRSVSYIFKERFSSLNFPIGFVIAFTGLCLCLMSKKLTKYNHFSWVRQKWQTFIGIVGLNRLISAYGPSYHLMPGVNTCRNVYSFFKLHHSFRRRLYFGIMKLSWESGLWGNICRAVLRFSKGLEMNHIVLINTYILQDHPELIQVEELKPEFRKLQIVFQEFPEENNPDEQWPYIQIMNKCSNDVWNKQNFPMLNYLAVQIGKRNRTDLNDYHCCKLSSEMRGTVNRVISEIIELDSISQILRDNSENSSETVDASVTVNNDEFNELFKVSDILEKSLYRLLGVRSFNKNDDLILISNTIPSAEIKCFRTSSDDAELLKIVCMFNVSRIYQGECLTEVIGGILTLFNVVGSETLSSDECKMPLKNHGLELSEISIESMNDLASHFVFENDELNDLFLKFLDLASSDFNSQSVVIKNNAVTSRMFENLFLKTSVVPNIYLYIGMYLLPIFKQLDKNNYKSWFEHKWIVFRRITNSHENVMTLSEFPLPTLNTCGSIYSFFHSNFELRGILFFKCVELLSKSSGVMETIFSVICHNAREAEMNHFYLINHYILQHQNYFLKMRELKPELLRFMRALEDIRKMLPSAKWWLYLKLFSHPNEVEFLNKNCFPLLLFIAESRHERKDKPRYAGVGKITEYFKKVKETAKKFDAFYNKALTDKNIQKFFELNYSNGDLLSTLQDEQLRQLTINSTLLSTCHSNQFGTIPDDRKQQIIDMSTEEVKKKYSHFRILQEFENLFLRLLGRRSIGTAELDPNEGGDRNNSNEIEDSANENEIESNLGLGENEGLSNLSEFENILSEMSLSDFINNVSEDDFQYDSSEDDFLNVFD